ncbi:hypothetical protein EDM59_20450 [Brevibacillus nitrificans]|uniref:Uncharacterized protein n=1 Tax=Brevibacillus nitrificans TaxID=651560 RepID=A0A3M8D514_9BACL|nr:hypothetical protein [Brevibacillus nitrificans]RNB82527.1 hypothetical protein EDM59_20450 [Brevibacillus nitrificans]
MLAFVNETNFKRYLMIVKSTGMIHDSLIRSQNVLNFGYILYLLLSDQGVRTGKDRHSPQCQQKTTKYGEIQDTKEVLDNLEASCIPSGIFTMNADHFEDFLQERSKLMANKIRNYYFSL